MSGEFAPEPHPSEYYADEEDLQAEYDDLLRIAKNLKFYRQSTNKHNEALKELERHEKA